MTFIFCFDVFYTTNYKGRKTYVVGAMPNDSITPQVWLDAEWRNSVKRISKTRSGKVLKVTYDDFQNVDGYFIESWLEFYVNDTLVQTERYNDIKVNPNLDSSVFDPQLFGQSYWY